MTLIRNSKFLSFFTLAAFLSSCVAKFPVSSISARDDGNKSMIQWPEIEDESGTQTVRMRPLENIDQMLLFELEVTNKSEEPIPITPESWQLGYFSNFDPNNLQAANSVSYPLTGAQVNQGYQKVADEIQAAKDGTTALIVLGIVVIVVALVIIASNSGGSGDSDIGSNSCAGFDDYVNLGVNLSFSFHNRSYHPPAIDDWSEKDKVKYFRNRGQELSKVYNGPQTIPPGETYYYGLFFPRNAAAQHLTLKGAIGEESYQWNFKHDGLNLPKVKM